MNTKTTPKDFFLHLGATVALYIVAGALINLSFSVINYFRPDALAGYFYGNSVAWPISVLVVLVPVLYLLEWLINRDTKNFPEKKDLWIRRWRIFLTLFLVVVLIAGDLITLINTYLNGEITSRLVYKVIAVLLIAGTIGKYYFFSLYSNFKWSNRVVRVYPWFGIMLVLLAIILGFVTVGSPTTQRNLRFDSQRVNDLNNIQWQIINYWQTKGKLPAIITDIQDPISGYTMPLDPETGRVYGYTSTSTSSFELCATFATDAKDLKGRGEFGGGYSAPYPVKDMSYPYPGGIDDNWNHDIGRTCFTRTIDPDRYPVNSTINKI